MRELIMEWINIKDHQPAQHQKVLVLARGTDVEQGEWNFYDLVDACCSQMLYAEYWMPIPTIRQLKQIKINEYKCNIASCSCDCKET